LELINAFSDEMFTFF